MVVRFTAAEDIHVKRTKKKESMVVIVSIALHLTPLAHTSIEESKLTRTRKHILKNMRIQGRGG